MKLTTKSMIVGALSLTLLLGSTACSASKEAEEPKISVQAVKMGDLLIGQYADGRISIPASELNFVVGGSIGEILVQPGQVVAAGDVLARLDPADLEAALKDAERTVAKAEASLSEAILSRKYTLSSEQVKLISLEREIYEARDRATEAYEQQLLKVNYLKADHSSVETAEIALEQAEEAYDEDSGTDAEALAVDKAKVALQNAITARDYNIALEEAKLAPLQQAYLEAQADIAEDPAIYTEYSQNYDIQKFKVDYLRQSDAAVETARFALDDAKAKLEKARSDLGKTLLKAPAAGIVSVVNSKIGDWVTAGASGATAGLITLAQTGTVQVNAYLAEADIVGVEVGQTMRIAVDALSLDNQAGTVTTISLTPKIDSTGIVSYLVTGEIIDPDPRILDGMTTFVTFVKREKPGVLLVANKAVFLVDGQQFVTVQKEDGTLEDRPVTCGLTNGTVSEVVEGLSAGEKVVTGGLQR
jgi:multidrug efflux pump subunit AcrA (membrane-fusion protein)